MYLCIPQRENVVHTTGFLTQPKICFNHDGKKRSGANSWTNEILLFANDLMVTTDFLYLMVKALMNGTVFSLC